MKKVLLFGGGGLFLLIILIIIISLASGGNGDDPGQTTTTNPTLAPGQTPTPGPTPTPEPTPTPAYLEVTVVEIYQAYLANEARANETYKNRDLLVHFTVDEIEDDHIIQFLDDIGWDEANLKTSNEYLIARNIGDEGTRLCTLDGFDSDTWLRFDCKMEQPDPTPTPVPTVMPEPTLSEDNEARLERWKERLEHWANVDAFQASMGDISTDRVVSQEESRHICFTKEQWTLQMEEARDYVLDYRQDAPDFVAKNPELGNLEQEAERALDLLSQIECE